MRPAVMRGCVTLSALLAGAAAGAAAQTVTPGAREIVLVNFASMPVGDFPKRADLQTQSSLEIVDHNGVHMLKAGMRSEFVITLPENLPELFTLEFDLVSQECCGSEDLSFEGTRKDPNQNSTKVTWSPALQKVTGGGGGEFTAKTTLTGGLLAHIIASIEGTTIKMYTNRDRLYTVSDRRFARGQVLRVSLGGADEDKGAVYLARVRVAEGAAAVTQIADQTSGGSGGSGGSTAGGGSTTGGGSTSAAGSGAGGGTQQTANSTGPASGTAALVQGVVAKVDAQGQASLSWQPVQGATSYFVARWLVADPVCCNNTSSPLGMTSLQWQDDLLPALGIYGYRVYAHTPSVIYTGETKLQTPPPLYTEARFYLGTYFPLGVIVIWGTVPNATAYRVYRKSDPTQPGILLRTVSAASAPTFLNEANTAVAVDADISAGAKDLQYWVQAELAGGTLSDPGPVTPVTFESSNSMSSWGFPLGPSGVSATVGGTTTITFNGQQGPGNKVTWTWDQDLSKFPVYLYFSTVEISPANYPAWTLYRSETISVPGVSPIPYLKTGDAVGPPYTLEFPAGTIVRFCVSFFPMTPQERGQNPTGCTASQLP